MTWKKRETKYALYVCTKCGKRATIIWENEDDPDEWLCEECKAKHDDGE